VATLPLYIKANRIDMKASGSEIDILLFLQKNGLFGQKKISVNGAEISPLDFFKRIAPPPRTPKEIVSMMNRGVIKDAEFVSTVDVRGTQDGKPYRVQYTLAYPNIWRIPEAYEGSTYISYPTGIAAGIFTQASFDIKERGVLPPEALDKQTAKTILNELGRFEVNSTRRNWSPKEQ
jgi:saccharopine dehydrogenase-like NADP-dependent oxidoreductase